MSETEKKVLTDNKPKFINEHLRHLKDSTAIDKTRLTAGDIIQFMYNEEKKTVMVLNPAWERKMHALDLNSIPRIYFLPILRESRSLTIKPKAFYEIKLKKDAKLKKLLAYRTFNVDKIAHVFIVDYR
jgi:hypothetical protein